MSERAASAATRNGLRGRVCVVTGASSGIGKATAWGLAREGAAVVLAARREDRLRALAADLESRGWPALAVRCDVTSPEDIRSLREAVEGEFGRCDVLVNNAGIPGGGPFADVSLGAIENVVATNLLSVLRATKEFLPLLRRARGHVVNVASMAGRYAVPGASVYAATKHAVVGFSESLYHELAPEGVMVTVVNPGLVETEGFPFRNRGRRLRRFLLRPEAVADVIVDVILRRRGPEVSVPRWLSAFQAARLLAPAPYRWGVARATRRRQKPQPG